MTLSGLQMKQYNEIKAAFEKADCKIINLSDADNVRLREVLTLLSMLGYIQEFPIDNTNAYQQIGDFKDFEIWHKDRIKEERKLSSREWKIGLVGALIGLIPFIVSTVIPWIISLIQR